ncbi:hypothetical protein [Aeoliella sp.]|uniref:hypothetical protein n=1 Tax=Aeoliella sp. TaxID=2795800 RepID=UPI003CCB966A
MSKRLLLTLLIVLPGCGGNDIGISVPDYNPPSFAQAVVAAADADSSASLSKQEAASLPGIASRWDRYDTDGDGALTIEEIEQRAQKWVDRDVAIGVVGFKVMHQGRQISQVSVQLVPEEVHNGAILPGMGESQEHRDGYFHIPNDLKGEKWKDRRGIQLGLYRVEVSHPKLDLELENDSLGLDIGRLDEVDPVVIRVKSKP